MSNQSVALIVIFNHRFDSNIPKLEVLYRGRFTHVYYLVPFYDGDRPNVIAVYENSYRFQGYIAQGLDRFFKEEFEHYLFVADDLVLHPDINENNYREHFQLAADSGFIPDLFEVHRLHKSETLRFESYRNDGETRWYWWRLMDLVNYRHRVDGLENSKEMPPYREAETLLRGHGYTVCPVKFADAYGPVPVRTGAKKTRGYILGYIKRLRHYRREYKIDYPVVASFSDLVIVPGTTIKKFAHFCGVFAANGLFVEFALPTALLLSTKHVVTETKLGKRGSIYWLYSPEETAAYAAAMKPYGKDLKRLMDSFPSDSLYIHPVKFSQWTV